MCGVDFQKPYDPVHRTLLWEVLAWCGGAAKMVTVIRHFVGGMRAWGHVTHGRVPEVVRGRTGLQQGCVLSPMLLSKFIAAVLDIVLQRFSGGPTAVGPKEATMARLIIPASRKDD